MLFWIPPSSTSTPSLYIPYLGLCLGLANIRWDICELCSFYHLHWRSRPLWRGFPRDLKTSSWRRLPSSRPRLLGVGITLPLYLSFDCVCELVDLMYDILVYVWFGFCLSVLSLCSCAFISFPTSKCEKIPPRVLPYYILVSWSRLIHILESLPLLSSLILFFSSQFKNPHQK